MRASRRSRRGREWSAGAASGARLRAGSVATEAMASRIGEIIFGKEKRRRVTFANAEVPGGVRVYAVGDIHGRVDLLDRLHAMILEDADDTAPGVRKIVVYLGDYLDRGLCSRELLAECLVRVLVV